MKTLLKKLLLLSVPMFIGFVLLYHYWISPYVIDVFVQSDSNYPTWKIGEWRYVNIIEEPKIGSFIYFKCLNSQKCSNTTIVHRLTSIDSQGCMTIIGDNPKYDWSKIPCFMPDDIKIIGVVHKLF